MRVLIEKVPALDGAGRTVVVDRHVILRMWEGQLQEMGQRYHYDNSHVDAWPDGTLVVAATGERLRMVGAPADDKAHETAG
ncbi:hypothetical protein WAE61_04250 [Comamonadaceae bacterium PP-2]